MPHLLLEYSANVPDPPDFDGVLEADVERAPEEQERPFEACRGAFNGRTHRRAPMFR